MLSNPVPNRRLLLTRDNRTGNFQHGKYRETLSERRNFKVRPLSCFARDNRRILTQNTHF